MTYRLCVPRPRGTVQALDWARAEGVGEACADTVGPFSAGWRDAAVRRPTGLRFTPPHQTELPHQAPHTPPPGRYPRDGPATELMHHPPRAIGREVGRDLVDRGLEFGLGRALGCIIPTAPGQPEYPADRRQRVICDQRADHLPFPRAGEVKSCEAFFAISSSMVSRPRRRSSSATRSASAVAAAELSKTSAARSSSCCFQRASRLSLIWCSRQSWAAVFCRVRASCHDPGFVLRLEAASLVHKLFSLPARRLPTLVGRGSAFVVKCFQPPNGVPNRGVSLGEATDAGVAREQQCSGQGMVA